MTHEKVKEARRARVCVCVCKSGFAVRHRTQKTDTHFQQRTSHSRVHMFTLNTHTHTHTEWVEEAGRSGLEVVKGAVCSVMEGRNGFALSDRAVTTALFHV